MMEDFDIYADLPSFQAEENENEQNNIKKYEEKNQILEKEVNLLKTKLEELENLNNKLKFNFSSLIKTAKAEISRKDRTITDLRAQLDNITFRRNQYRGGKMQVKNNHYLNYPPPPVNNKFNNRVKQQQDNRHIPENQLLVEENIKKEYIETETQQKASDEEHDDPITNKSEYKSTIYGDRLRKRLMEEKEVEKRKKEEESKQKNECFDKVNNKENLAQINEAAQKVDTNINSDKTLDTVNHSTDIKTDATLIKKIDYLESKEDLLISRKNDIPKNNKYFTANGTVSNLASKTYSNDYNDSSTHKDYRNHDHSNNHHKHKLNDPFYAESNNRYSRRDKYVHSFEKYGRHRSSHRYKSIDRDRSSSSSGTKDDFRKKHYKPLDDKHDYVSKKIRLHKNDKEDKRNRSPSRNKLHKRDTDEKNKKHKEYKIKSSKHKRRSESEEKISEKNKRRKISNQNDNRVNDLNKNSIEETKNNNYESKKGIQERERKKLKSNDEKLENGKECVKETTKLNKIPVSEVTAKQKENVQDKEKQDKKKITIKEYNEKISNNLESVKDSVKSNKNATKETKTYNFEQKETIEKQELNQKNNVLQSGGKTSSITDVKEINQKTTHNIESLLEELEEGEIVDSPHQGLGNNCVDNKKEDDNKTDNKTSKETIVLENFKKPTKNKTKEILNSCKLENNDLSKTDIGNFKSPEIITNKDVHYVKRSPKKIEDKNTESTLLFALLSQGTSEKYNNSIYNKIQENTIEKSKLNVKSAECENILEKRNETSTINKKLIEYHNDKINNKTLALDVRPEKLKDDNDKLESTDSDKISQEKNNETRSEEKSVINISNIEEHAVKEKLQIEKNESNDFCIEKNQNISDTKLQKNKEQETNISDNNLNEQVVKPLNDEEVPSTNKETENGSTKKTVSASKPQSGKNIIIIKRRRRIVQLSDSPPVLVINEVAACKTA